MSWWISCWFLVKAFWRVDDVLLSCITSAVECVVSVKFWSMQLLYAGGCPFLLYRWSGLKYRQWRRFFFGKPRRKFKVDINDAGIDVINTWVWWNPDLSQRQLGIGEKEGEKDIIVIIVHKTTVFARASIPLLGSTQRSSHLCPHSCHWLTGYWDILYFYRWIPVVKLCIYHSKVLLPWFL